MSDAAAKSDRAGTIVLDGRAYALEDLSDKARGLAESLRMADQEIARAQALAAMLNVARQSYAHALRVELEACGAVGTEAG